MAKDDQWLLNATIANILAPFRGAQWKPIFADLGLELPVHN